MQEVCRRLKDTAKEIRDDKTMRMDDDDVLTVLEGGNDEAHGPAESQSYEKKKEKKAVDGGAECALAGA